jgi:hypothetical protein
MIHIPTLLAIEDFLDSFVITSVNETDLEVILTIASNSKSSDIKVKAEVNKLEIYSRMRLSNELLNFTDPGELINYGNYLLEKVVEENIKNPFLINQEGLTLLTYSIGNRKVVNKPVYLKDKNLLIAAKLIRNGYTIEEIKGVSISIITPSGISRCVSNGDCDCQEFNVVLKSSRPCRHLTLLKVFQQHRNLFYKHGLLTYVT